MHHRLSRRVKGRKVAFKAKSAKRRSPEPILGWGKRIKVLKVGEIVKFGAERIEFRERTGIGIPHIKHNIPVGHCHYIFCLDAAHVYKSNKEKVYKTLYLY